MAEFCSCGSLKINGNCTNKNCSNRASAKTAAPRTGGSRTATAKELKPKPEASPSRKRRASKCITYNLYDIQKEEETQ